MKRQYGELFFHYTDSEYPGIRIILDTCTQVHTYPNSSVLCNAWKFNHAIPGCLNASAFFWKAKMAWFNQISGYLSKYILFLIFQYLFISNASDILSNFKNKGGKFRGLLKI